MTISIEEINRQIERRLEEIEHLSRRRALLESLPEDIFENGNIISFTKHFAGTSTEYSYAAIKARGLWYTTGPKSPKAYTWTDLIEWLGADAMSIAYCSEFEEMA
jgi:hypothetical protein